MSNSESKKIAYCGIEGAWANIAAKRVFPDCELIPFSSFSKAYSAVENKECEAAVLPVENSYAGDVGQVFDLMHNGSLVINSIYNLQISQALLGPKGSKAEDIKKVISHQQAIDQCMEYLQQNKIEIETATNTAVAAKEVAQLNDKTVGAIASEEAAALYGLEVLRPQINHNTENTTRFAIFTRDLEQHTEKEEEKIVSLLMFSVKNLPGALAKAVQIIGDDGFNLLNIRSRPIKDVPWQYYFYIEVEGSLITPKGIKLLNNLSQVCVDAKILGSYKVK